MYKGGAPVAARVSSLQPHYTYRLCGCHINVNLRFIEPCTAPHKIHFTSLQLQHTALLSQNILSSGCFATDSLFLSYSRTAHDFVFITKTITGTPQMSIKQRVTSLDQTLVDPNPKQRDVVWMSLFWGTIQFIINQEEGSLVSYILWHAITYKYLVISFILLWN